MEPSHRSMYLSCYSSFWWLFKKRRFPSSRVWELPLGSLSCYGNQLWDNLNAYEWAELRDQVFYCTYKIYLFKPKSGWHGVLHTLKWIKPTRLMCVCVCEWVREREREGEREGRCIIMLIIEMHFMELLLAYWWFKPPRVIRAKSHVYKREASTFTVCFT